MARPPLHLFKYTELAGLEEISSRKIEEYFLPVLPFWCADIVGPARMQPLHVKKL